MNFTRPGNQMSPTFGDGGGGDLHDFMLRLPSGGRPGGRVDPGFDVDPPSGMGGNGGPDQMKALMAILQQMMGKGGQGGGGLGALLQGLGTPSGRPGGQGGGAPNGQQGSLLMGGMPPQGGSRPGSAMTLAQLVHAGR